MFDELLGLADRVQDKSDTEDLQKDSVDDDTKADGQVAKSNVEKNRANDEGDRFSVLKDVGLDGLYNLTREIKPDPDKGREEPGHSDMDILEAIERSALQMALLSQRRPRSTKMQTLTTPLCLQTTHMRALRQKSVPRWESEAESL